MRYFLIDKVTSLKLKDSAIAIKCITFTDQIMHDHFPGLPIMPGALIVEGLAQVSGFLLDMTYNHQNPDKVVRAALIQIDKMKFHGFSTPGETLKYYSTIKSMHQEAARVEVKATMEGELRAKGMLTFSLLEYQNESLNQQRLWLYKIWAREIENCPNII